MTLSFHWDKYDHNALSSDRKINLGDVKTPKGSSIKDATSARSGHMREWGQAKVDIWLNI